MNLCIEIEEGNVSIWLRKNDKEERPRPDLKGRIRTQRHRIQFRIINAIIMLHASLRLPFISPSLLFHTTMPTAWFQYQKILHIQKERKSILVQCKRVVREKNKMTNIFEWKNERMEWGEKRIRNDLDIDSRYASVGAPGEITYGIIALRRTIWGHSLLEILPYDKNVDFFL